MTQKVLLYLLASAAGAGFLTAQVVLNPAPSRALGQTRLQVTAVQPNLVDFKALFLPQAVALDTSTSPPILYVADTGNNRVLGWRNATSAGNGAPADVVVGQRDEFSAFPQGPRGSGDPRGTLSTGLAGPTGLAVDRNGNLYVADAGNNRILRYPRPLERTPDSRLPDMVIGQERFTEGFPNRGQSTCAANTLAFSPSNLTFPGASCGACSLVGMTFDASGNLWVTDPLNHRVLRFPSSLLGSTASSLPPADIVLGQGEFTSRSSLGLTTQNRLVRTGMNDPSSVAVDSAGRVYVGDALVRILVFGSPQPSTGASAARILGIGTGTPPTDTLFRGAINGLFFLGSSLAAVDTLAHRILRFDPFDTWPLENVTFSPPARAVTGQPDFVSAQANRGLREPNETTFNAPVGAVATDTNVFLADALNNRVLVLPVNGNTIGSATRLFGQEGFGFSAPNAVEGRELNINIGTVSISGATVTATGTGIAIDRSTNPPPLYIADTLNHRILAWRDSRRARTGDRADLVIGQGEGAARFYRTLVNSGSTSAAIPTDSSLSFPAAIAVDGSGNLWVADAGNSRVLRFPAPFRQPEGSLQRANLVIGQPGFNITIVDPTPTTMRSPQGLAFTQAGHLLVSDGVHNRVLLFRRPEGGDFTNGQAASAVFGQPDFTSVGGGTEDNRFISPRHIAVDTDDRLYVADAGNSRISVFARAGGPDPDPRASLLVNATTAANVPLRNPHGLYVSRETGEIWVADTFANRLVRYPRFDLLLVGQFADFVLGANTPLAVVEDEGKAIFAAEAANRIVTYFPWLRLTNAGNFVEANIDPRRPSAQQRPRPISPGQYATLFSTVALTPRTEVFSTVPMPTTLADIQVLVNDRPMPIYFIAEPTGTWQGQINFITPVDMPTTGTVDITVRRASTEQIIGVTTVSTGLAAPALYTQNSSGSGAASALNQDNTLNTPTNPIPRGQVISLFGTGQGIVPNAPKEGETAGTGAVTLDKPEVFINGLRIPEENVEYSGLAPNLIALWQINVRIPQ
ncbi:MAG: hypothetical protein SFV54_12300, partial [Bryobacteraceae bacterium]|nr:hypothetical protein [Bryobacteraceae bacterium]